ncbi:HNH endonuclease [Microbacterium sp. JZ101]
MGWEPTPAEVAVTRSAVERARRARALRAEADALEIEALAEAGEVARAQLARSGAVSSRYDFPFRAMAGEFAAALGESKGRMQTRLGDAMVLVGSFPETFAALEGARITGRHAGVIRQVGMRLPDGLREVFEAAAVGYAEGATPFETRVFAEALAERLDPRSFSDRHRSAMARRGVWVKVLPDGTQALEIVGEATRIQAIARALRQHARDLARQERRAAETETGGGAGAAGAGVAGGSGVRFEDSERVGEGGEGPRTAKQIASDLAVEVLSALCSDPDDTPAPWTTDADTTDTDATDVGDADDVNVDAAGATADTDSVAPDAGTEDDGTKVDADDLGVDAGSDVSDAARTADRADAGADPVGAGAESDPPGTADAARGPGASPPDGSPPDGGPPRGAPPSVRGLVGDVDRVLSRVRAVVQVTVAATTLAGLDDEPGFLAGYGPIDADTARKLAGNAAGWERVFCHPDTGALLTVDRYTPTAAQKRYLLARDERCRTPGCRNLALTADLDHTIPYAQGGVTDVGNLACLCEGCHQDKHHTPWQVRQLGDGVLEWTSPAGHTYTEKPPPQARAEATPNQLIADALAHHHRDREHAEQRRRARQHQREQEREQEQHQREREQHQREQEEREREQEERERERRLHLEIEQDIQEWLRHYRTTPEYLAQALLDADDIAHHEDIDHGADARFTLEPA